MSSPRRRSKKAPRSVRKKHTPPAATDKHVSRLRAPVRLRQTMEGNRFTTTEAGDIPPEVVAFGKAMTDYLRTYRRVAWTPGQVLDVLLSMGYRNHVRDFRRNIRDFTAALAKFRRGTRPSNRRRFPTWGEVLDVAKRRCGWYLRAAPNVNGQQMISPRLG